MAELSKGNIPNSNIFYVEPNYTINAGNTLGLHGEHTNELAPALEDYCIFVNLAVEVRGRTINISKDSEGKRFIVNWESTQGKGTADFLQGTKFDENIAYDGISRCSLTTRYTDTFVEEVKDGSNNEMFGISSIDIEYNNMMVPQVSISFVDVRGVSLFSPEENAHNVSQNGIYGYNNPDIAGSFFKSFFTFPYPRFILAVKGFYGQAVSYELTCSDWRATFDSSTGNFNVNAKFVGYQFAFLGDVMINALTAAPCSDYLGKSYWKNAVSSGRFTVMDLNGNMVAMPTIAELLVKYNNALKEASAAVASSEVASESNRIDSEADTINNVSSAYQAFTEGLINSFKNEEGKGTLKNYRVFSGNSFVTSFVYIDKGQKKSRKIEDVIDNNKKEDDLESLYEALSGQCTSYTSSNEGKSLSLPFNAPSSWSTIQLFKTVNGKAVFVGNESSLGTSYKEIKAWGEEVVNKANKIHSEKPSEPNIIDSQSYYYAVVFSDGGFTKSFSKLKENNKKQLDENTKKKSEEETKQLSESLGFKPTVENMTRILMAHFETFVHMIRQTAINIESLDPQRTPDSLGLSKNNLSDLSSNSEVVPPFPKVTEIGHDSSGNDTQEETWIGKFDGKDWLEKDLVNGLINGIAELSNAVEIFRTESGGNTEGGNETVVTQMKYPLSPLDVMMKGKPYGSEMEFNDVSDVIGKVVIRAFNILSLTSFNSQTVSKNIEKLAKIEAHNFDELFSEVPDSFISKVVDDNNSFSNIALEVMFDGDGSKSSIYGKNLGNGNFKYAWVNPRVPFSYPLLWSKNSFYFLSAFVASENDMNKAKRRSNIFSTYCPTCSYSFDSLFNNFTKCKVEGNNYPIYEKPRSLANIVTNGELSKDNDYKIADKNAIFFDSSPKKFKNMIDNNFQSDEGLDIDFVKDMFSDFNYEDSRYESLFKNTDEIYIPITDYTIPEGMKEPCIFPLTVRNVSEAEKNNYFNGKDVNVENYNKINFFNDNENVSVEKNESFFTDLNESNCTLHLFYGVDDDGDIDDDYSVFGSNYYYKFKTIEFRAILFLLSLGYYINYRKTFELLCGTKSCVFIPKAAILLFGASLLLKRRNIKEDGEDEDTDDLRDKIDDFTPNSAYLLRNDVQNIYINYFLDWVNGEFRKDIAANMEIPFKTTPEDFFKKVTDGVFNDDVEDNPEKFLLENCNTSKLGTFFQNYLSVGDVDNGSHSLLLANRDTGYGVITATRVCLKMYAVIKGHRLLNRQENNTSYPQNIYVKKDDIKKYITSFFEELKNIYNGTKSEDEENGADIQRASNETKSTEDIKIAIYRYCKLLYDKWIAGDSTDGRYKMEYFFDNDDASFIFIDTYYKKIGQKIIINIGDFMKKIVECQSQQQYTLLSFLSAIYAQNKFNFFCISNFLDLSKQENIENMFRPIPYLDMEIPKNMPNFIVMYPYEPSSHLDTGDESEYPGDSFVIYKNGENLPKPLLYGSSSDYLIPAFGVSYGKMYQSYFTDISVGMENPITTDQSIKAQFEIASMNNTQDGASDKKMVTIGQDLFTVYSNNSYTCTVQMMGCAWVQPLMYFCLTNVPLFRGTYIIINVTHQITPGNMKTTFKGVRMANTMSRRVRDWNVVSDATNNGDGENTVSDYKEKEYAAANVGNNCEYKFFPISNSNGTSFENELDAKITRDMITTTNGDVHDIKYLIGKTVANVLAVMVDIEAGATANDLQKGLIATSMYNRRCQTGWKTEVFNAVQMSCLRQENKTKYDSAPTDSSLRIVREIFTNGPLYLVGNTTIVTRPFVEKKNGIKFKQGTTTHSTTIDESDLKKIYFWVNPYVEKDMTLYNKYCGPIMCQHQASEGAYEHVFCARQDAKDCWTNTKIRNDKNKSEIDDFAKAFAMSIHKTCESSEQHCNIGVDENNTKGDTIIFTCDIKEHLAVAFDVCLSYEYFKYVYELRWVIPTNGTGKEYPLYIIAKVTNRSTPNRTVGIFYENGSQCNVSDCNSDYTKSIAKFLNGVYEGERVKGKSSFIKTMPSEESIKENMPQECSDIIGSDDGVHNYGEGGVIDGNGMIGNWNARKALNHARKNARSKSIGLCARYTLNAIAAGNVRRLQWKTVAHADYLYYDHILEENGWVIVSEGVNRADFASKSNAKAGDVCVMTVHNGVSKGYSHGFHVCIFDGNNWYSDFKQNNCIVYSSTCKKWWLFRYSGSGMKST